MQESMLQMLISMTQRRPLFFQGSDCLTKKSIVNGIQAEDGSGTGFNVTLADGTVTYIKRPIGSGLTESDPIRARLTVRTNSVVVVGGRVNARSSTAEATE